MIAFRVGYEDAEILAAHFHPPNAMAPHAFSDLSQYEAWARIMRYGEVSDPIRITTLPRGARILIQHSRDRFATRRAVDAEAIASRLAVGNAVTNDGLGELQILEVLDRLLGLCPLGDRGVRRDATQDDVGQET